MQQLLKIQQQQKERYDETKRYCKYQPNDLVLVYKPYRKKRHPHHTTTCFANHRNSMGNQNSNIQATQFFDGNQKS